MNNRWNHNIHYHPILLDAVPINANIVLDVGCGEGTLARALRSKAKRVVGIDLDEASITIARNTPIEGIEYIIGDFLSYSLPPESFDAVLSVATLHHMNAVAGLRRMRDLVRPGGIIGIIGLARDESLIDHAISATGLAAHRLYLATRQYWEHPSPKAWPPPESWSSMRRIAAQQLPGVRYQRHILWRYSMIWVRPH